MTVWESEAPEPPDSAMEECLSIRAANGMKPEIVYGLSWPDYLAIDKMNPSRLKHIQKSALRMKRAMAGECDPDPKNVAVGSAAHAILSGEFDDRYATMPAFELDADNLTATGKQSKNKGTTYYKESAAAWMLANESKEIVTEVQVATASKVANRVRSKYGKLLDASQQEVVVTGEIDGLKMKTRLDGLVADRCIVWDLKTTADISDDAFYRVFKRLGYGFSTAVHVELLRQNGIEVVDYRIIAAEVQDDYDVRLLTVPIAAIDVYLPRVRLAVGAYQRAMVSGHWPGLPDGDLKIPNWDLVEESELDWG